MKDNRTITRIDTWTNWLLAVIVLIPFIISANALADLADKHGVQPSWLYPVMVDGGLIIFKLLVLRSALRGRTDRYAWSMAVSATVVSVVLNVVHAQADLLSQAMSALPPLVILAAFIAVSRRLEETAVEEGHVANLADLSRQIADKTQDIGRLDTDLAQKETQHATAVAQLQESFAAEQTQLEAKAEALRTQIETLKAVKTAAQRELADTKRQQAADKTAVEQDTPLSQKADTPSSSSDLAGHQPPDNLTERQVRVLAYLKNGQSREDIAALEQVSVKTIYRDIKALNGTAKAVLSGGAS